MNHVRKITISALLISLVIIVTRFFSIQNLAVIPFLRISLGPALIIFASLYLGPFYGAIVGAGSDILGIVLVPNQLGYSINPLITVVYGLLGVVPWILLKVIEKNKNEKVSWLVMIMSSFIIFTIVSTVNFIFDNFEIQNRIISFSILQKFLISTLIFLLTAGNIFLVYLTKKFFDKKFPETYIKIQNIAFISIVTEIVVFLVLNTIAKTITFGSFWFMLFVQGIVYFIDVPLNTFVVSYLLLLSKKI